MIEDAAEIERLAKIVSPNPYDINSIWEMYKKYVRADAPAPNLTGCRSCSANSISRYWRELLDWYNKNK